jgi:hypothetical protein
MFVNLGLLFIIIFLTKYFVTENFIVTKKLIKKTVAAKIILPEAKPKEKI